MFLLTFDKLHEGWDPPLRSNELRIMTIAQQDSLIPSRTPRFIAVIRSHPLSHSSFPLRLIPFLPHLEIDEKLHGEEGVGEAHMEASSKLGHVLADDFGVLGNLETMKIFIV